MQKKPNSVGDKGTSVEAVRPENHVPLPRLWAMAVHGFPRLVEGVLAPLGLFYLFLIPTGVHGAIWASLGWTYAAVVFRLVARQRVSGILVLAALAMTLRTLMAFVMKSTFIYFLQPSLGTAMVGLLFLLSVPFGQPLAQRLANDFMPLPTWLLRQPAVRRAFVRITLLWAFTNLLSAAGTIALLVTTPLSTYMAVKTGLSTGLFALTVAASTVLFKRGCRPRKPAIIG